MQGSPLRRSPSQLSLDTRGLSRQLLAVGRGFRELGPIAKLVRVGAPDVLMALTEALPALAEQQRQRARARTRRRITQAFPSPVPNHTLGSEQRSWDWWERRAMATEQIEGSVLDCEEGSHTTKIKCLDCGQAFEVPYRCQKAFLCSTCRKEEQARRRRKVTRAVAEHQQGRDAWKLRMITLTVPHCQNAEERIGLSLGATPPFERWLRGYLGEELSAWWASWELTGGDDGHGHPHWHYLCASPWLPQPVIAAAWATELVRIGGQEVADALPSKPAVEVVRWIYENAFRTARREKAYAEIARHIRVPWAVGSFTAPRRNAGEHLAAYVARRSEWAERKAWVLGVPARTRSFARIIGACPYWLWSEEERSAALRTSRVLLAIVDTRYNPNKPVAELIKYTVKTEGRDAVSTWLHGVAFVATRFRRLYRTSLRRKPEPKEHRGCPCCGSKRLRKDAMSPEIKGDFWTFVRKVRRELHDAAKPPPRAAPVQLRLVS